MKKISLKNLNLKEVEQLSREQLKGVLGGFTGTTGGTGTDDGGTTEAPGCLCSCDNHEGSWRSESCEGGNSSYCRTKDGNSPGPYSCA